MYVCMYVCTRWGLLINVEKQHSHSILIRCTGCGFATKMAFYVDSARQQRHLKSDRKSAKKRRKIGQHRRKIDEKSVLGSLGRYEMVSGCPGTRLGTLLEAPGSLLGRSRRLSGRSWDAPGSSRDVPERSRAASGSLRSVFGNASWQRYRFRTPPVRFSDDFTLKALIIVPRPNCAYRLNYAYRAPITRTGPRLNYAYHEELPRSSS